METVNNNSHLLTRLNEIGRSLESTGKALALLGLGSAGKDRERMDAYSDLDFFAIVAEGGKPAFLENLSWLTGIAPGAYWFKNTVDGYKFLYEDGIFCEFAVFEPDELPAIAFAEGQSVWTAQGFDPANLKPTSTQGRYTPNKDLEWQLGEALTNLYVGMGRYCRGERLSAFKFIQSHALDRIIDLLHLRNTAAPVDDLFGPDRRFEQRCQPGAELMAAFCQGYERTPASAEAQLTWLESNFEVNDRIAGEIQRLIAASV